MPFPAPSGCAWCCGCMREAKEEDGGTEVIVHVNDRESNAQYNFPDNFIRTSEYSVFTFIPIILFLQFKKASNFYFFVCMVLTLIPGISPLSPATAIMPFVFVLAVTLIKEGAEEYRRQQADRKQNAIEVELLVDNEVMRVAASDLRVGDIVRIHNGEEVRADLLCLSTSGEDGQVFIDTCNLDGEVSLKCRRAIEATQPFCTLEKLQTAKIIMHTTRPEPELLSWSGRIDCDGEQYAVNIDQFIYCGCVIRNTDWIWAFVVYAGRDTKMIRNLRKRFPKSSDLDKKLNTLIILVLILQNIFLIVLSSLAVAWNKSHGDHWYLVWYIDRHSAFLFWVRQYVTYFILLSYLIPISLFVTIEVCKVIQVYWMHRDDKMVECVNGRWCRCKPNTSNLNEQLAMTRFIFTDKTGTLTENTMKFKYGDIKGHTIFSEDRETSLKLLDRNNPMRAAAVEYFLALSICHTIQPFPAAQKPFDVVYEGSSPDEVALVTTAAEHGFCLVERTTRSMTVNVEGQRRVFDILATLEFTPERKMMSIVVQERHTERIIFFTKGADSSVGRQLSTDSDTQEHMQCLETKLKDLAARGLRTLLFATREITREEFQEWNKRYRVASMELVHRREIVDKLCTEIEQELRVLGATAIEDKLQDEVPETVSFFLEAGVVIWMLTGDKRETAVTIAATAMLCEPLKDSILHVDIGSFDPNDPEAIERVGTELRQVELHIKREKENGVRTTIVIDGPALSTAMNYHFDLFLNVSKNVNSAVCCRLTPLQKANVVRMFQKSTGLTAIAIGDGANDVSMIQEGRVGVGIIGLEGSQAAAAADYAIPRFKNLRRLCAVHGRYSLVRNASCILVSFYKNVLISWIQVIFSFYCGYSGLTLFDGWMLVFYNVLLTSCPAFFLGIFDTDLPAGVVMKHPKLFTPLSRGLYFDTATLSRWLAESILDAVVIFFAMYPTGTTLDYDAHHNISGSMFGTMMLCALLCVVLLRFGLQVRCWRWMHILGMVISLIFVFIFLVTYSLFKHIEEYSFYWHIFVLISGAKFWFFLLLLPGFLSLILDLSVLHLQKRFRPTLRDRAEEEHLRAVRGY